MCSGGVVMSNRLLCSVLLVSLMGCVANPFGPDRGGDDPDEDVGEEVARFDTETLWAVTQDVEATIKELRPAPGTPLEERDLLGELEAIASVLADLPGVDSVYVYRDVLNAQVVLMDGTFFLVSNNRPLAAERVESAQQSNFTAFPPGDRRAVVTAFDGGEAIADEVRGIVQAAGYDVLGLNASLSSMRAYTDLGLLYLDTHAAAFYQVRDMKRHPDGHNLYTWGERSFGLQTATIVDESLLNLFREELIRGDLIVNYDADADAGDRPTKIAITPSFIQRHWSFKDGVVILHSCFGGSRSQATESSCHGECRTPAPGSYDPTPLRDAMAAVGANVVFGFDNYTNTERARPTIRYFLDRMLGDNNFLAPTPPQRPFHASAAHADLATAGLDSFTMPDFFRRYDSLTFDVHATLDVQPGRDGILAPSIEQIEVIDDADQTGGVVTITGAFGDTTGTVEVDGTPLSVDSWTPEEIEAQLPFVDVSGDLVVKSSADIESNAVPLTEWSGDLTLTYATGEYRLRSVAELDLHFRADVHPSRPEIGVDPIDPTPRAYFLPRSTGILKGAGWAQLINNPGGGFHVYQGEDELELFGRSAADNLAVSVTSQSHAFGGYVDLDRGAGQAEICVFAMGVHDYFKNLPYSEDETGTVEVGPEFAAAGDRAQGQMACFTAAMDEEYRILSGSRGEFSVFNHEPHYEVTWTDFTPTNIPDTDTPR